MTSQTNIEEASAESAALPAATEGAPQVARKVPLFRRAASFLLKSGRAAVFCACCLAVGLLLGSRAVSGQLGEKGMSLGRDLLPFADLLYGTHEVYFNGEKIYFASALSPEDKHAILDRFEETCREHSGGLIEEFDRLPEAKKRELQKKAPMIWGMRFGMVRREYGDEGMVICFAQNGGGGLKAMVQKLSEFAKTGELGALGNLRYAYVRATEEGRSHVLTTFTEGRFNLFRALGRDGEPGGQDPPGVPRLPGSRRILSVSADGAPYGVQSYEVDRTAAQVGAFYRDELPKLGWKLMVGDDELLSSSIYQRGGIMLTVSAMELVPGQKSGVTFTEGSSVNPRPDFIAEVH
jgi:hypothetical protein